MKNQFKPRCFNYQEIIVGCIYEIDMIGGGSDLQKQKLFGMQCSTWVFILYFYFFGSSISKETDWSDIRNSFKIPTYRQDLWAISANVNIYFGLVVTHSFTNFTFKLLKCGRRTMPSWAVQNQNNIPRGRTVELVMRG